MTEALSKQVYSEKRMNMGALDIETRGFKDGFILGRVKHSDGRAQNFTSPEAMLRFILDTPKDPKRRHTSEFLWAHNGAGFDFTYLAQPLIDLCKEQGIQAEPIAQGDSKFIGVVIPQKDTKRGYKVTLLDSFAVCAASLEAVSAAFAPDMPKMGHCPQHDFQDGRWFDPGCRTCLLYLERDVDTLLVSMTNLEKKIWDIFRSPLGITAGSTAIRGAKACLPEGMVYFRLRPDIEQWVRPAVHGGFVWPGHRIGHRGPAVTYDRSGAYAHQLRQGLPYGGSLTVNEYDASRPGIWQAEVNVPHDIPIPILPSETGSGLPAYPTGRFTAKFTSLEIEYAEKLGCEVNIIEGVTWDRYVYPFNDFVDKCEGLEYPAEGKPELAVKNIVKLMRNSVAGKFATRSEMDSYVISDDADNATPFIDPVTHLPIGVWRHNEKKEVKGAGYIHPHWNAFITARQRLDMHKILMAGGQQAYYCDTDSFYGSPEIGDSLLSQGIIDEGKTYGKFHPEGDWKELVVVAPKVKSGLCRAHQLKDGSICEDKWHHTAKGIPSRKMDDSLMLAAAEGIAERSVEWESPTSFKRKLLKPSLPLGVDRNRRYSILANSGSWVCDTEGYVRPAPAGYKPGQWQRDWRKQGREAWDLESKARKEAREAETYGYKTEMFEWNRDHPRMSYKDFMSQWMGMQEAA